MKVLALAVAVWGLGCGSVEPAGDADADVDCVSVDAVTVSDVDTRSDGVALAATADGYAVAWSDDREGDSKIFFARLGSAGDATGGNVRVTDASGGSFAPAIVRAGDDLGLAWYGAGDGNSEIYFARLDEDGAAATAARVTDDAARSEFPSLVWTGDEYGLAWNDDRSGAFEVFFARLGANGSPAGDSVATRPGASPSLAFAGGDYGVAYHDVRGADGLQVFFTPLGADGTAGVEAPASVAADGNGGAASVAAAPEGFVVAWMHDPGTSSGIRTRLQPAAGEPAEPSVASDTGSDPSIAAGASGLAVAWTEAGGVFLAELDGAGVPTGAPARVSSASDARGVRLVSAAGGWALAWIEAPSGEPGRIRFAAICP